MYQVVISAAWGQDYLSGRKAIILQTPRFGEVEINSNNIINRSSLVVSYPLVHAVNMDNWTPASFTIILHVTDNITKSVIGASIH